MTRSHEHEIEIQASTEAVWRALTEGDELVRWFAEEARTTPGEGGSVWLSWGGEYAGESRIDVWEPSRRLRLVDTTWATPDVTLVEEWTLETRGGATVLRLVHSGIPDSPDWDEMYDGTNRGWEIFLRTLRHYLERHPGEPRRTIYSMAKLERVDGVWERLTRPDGPFGRLAGQELFSRPGTALLAVAPALDEGLVALAIEGNLLWCTVSAYGDARDRLDELEAPVRAEMEGVPA